MRKGIALAGLAVMIAAAPIRAEAQSSFEALVEDALERNAQAAPPPPAGQAPASAVPPRLQVAPAPGAAAPPPAVAPQAAPALPAPAVPQAQNPAPVAPAEAGARPYTPPAAPEPPAAAAEVPHLDAAPAGASAAVPAANPAAAAAPAAATERTLASLGVEEVNSAIYAEHAEDIRGASPLVLKAQVLLDRAGASPGVVDGYFGGNVAKAIAAVETVLGLPVDGALDPQVWSAIGGDAAPDVLVPYVITADDLAGPFVPEIPSDFSLQAEMEALAYTSPAEMFAERFHMDVELLQTLNPSADFGRPGTTIIVAAIDGPAIAGKIARIEADKKQRQVRAYDAQDRLVVAYPATIGSTATPSPSGTHRVEAIAADPVYYYNPANFVQGDNMEPLELPPGPNNPVGTMWIDLSQPGYGIHGTPEPSRIDKTSSNGCVRLTNWDAEELAGLVEPGVVVSFLE